MSELHEGAWHKRPYGWRADGVVEAQDHNIHVTVRKPDGEPSGETVILENGWTAGKNSMRVPAIVATQFGHRSVTVEYTNTGTQGALESNVEDVVAVVDAEPDEYERVLMGLSMGGSVATLAMRRAMSKIKRADLVAPGKYILPRFYTVGQVGRRFIAEGGEITQIGKHPIRAAALGSASVANCMRRPLAVYGEIKELLNGTVHEDLRAVKAQPDAPFVRFSHGLHDKLLPSYAQVASIEGLPFDDVFGFKGGHARLAYDPSLSWELFTMGSEPHHGSDSQPSPMRIAA